MWLQNYWDGINANVNSAPKLDPFMQEYLKEGDGVKKSLERKVYNLD